MSEASTHKWKDRLALYVNGKYIGIRDKSYSIRSPKERLHTVGEWNAGWHHLPHEFTLTFTTYAVGDVGKFLSDLQDADVENLQIVIARKEGTNWTFESVGFSRGTISSVTGGGFDARGVPILTVECEFLEWTTTSTTT
jgi:hypothetical protein